MQAAAHRLLLLSVIVLGCWVMSGCRHAPSAGQAAAPEALQVGAAELDITPPVGCRLAGYFEERPATGMHDPLKAKALVLRQGQEQLALVFCDLVGLPRELTAKARAQASRQTGIPVSHIVIGATHSHTGPLFEGVPFRYFHASALARSGSDPNLPLDYGPWLEERLVEVLRAAQASERPAQVSVGFTQQEGLSFNRRYLMKSGKVAFNPGRLNPQIVRPAGPSDASVGILLAREGPESQPFAGLTVFAMHSDTVGGTLYSADYEFYLQETLRATYGADFISLFGAGTCGDLNHVDVSRPERFKSFAMAEHVGQSLGQAVLGASASLPVLSRPALAVKSQTRAVELQPISATQLAQAQALSDKLGDAHTPFLTKVEAVRTLDLAERGSSWPMEIQVLRLDAQTALVCLPGELFVELGQAIRRASPFKTTLVITICNDRPSYVPTRKAFSEGSYEVNNARVRAGTGELLVQRSLELLKQLKAAPLPRLPSP